MSQITLANLMTFVRAFIPNYPQAKIGNFGNLVLEEVYERLTQVEYLTFTTVAPVTTGTVNVSNGSASVTFSSSVLNTTDGLRVVQIGSDATWYVLTRLSGTTGTLSSLYAGTTSTTASFKIAYPTVSLPAAVGKVLAIHREGYEDLLFAPSTDLVGRCRTGTTGAPQFFSPYAMDGAATPDDAERLLLTPFPDAGYAFAYQFLKRPTLFNPDASDTSTEKIPIPQDFGQAIRYGTLALCLAAENKDVQGWDKKAEEALRKAMAHGATVASGRRRSAYDTPPRGNVYQNTPSA